MSSVALASHSETVIKICLWPFQFSKQGLTDPSDCQ